MTWPTEEEVLFNIRDGLTSNDVERSSLRRSIPLTDLRHDTALTSELVTLDLTSTDGVKDILRRLTVEFGLSSRRRGLGDLNRCACTDRLSRRPLSATLRPWLRLSCRLSTGSLTRVHAHLAVPPEVAVDSGTDVRGVPDRKSKFQRWRLCASSWRRKADRSARTTWWSGAPKRQRLTLSVDCTSRHVASELRCWCVFVASFNSCL